MKITESRIFSVMSFYSLFSIKPRGKFIIQVCRDIPCHINGATDIVRSLENQLLIKMGETTPDQIFTLEYTSCLGCCDKAPAIRIGNEIFGNLTESLISKMIADYRRKFYEERE
jgi:NADH:ubiquinone oxidoreductase subunit E